MIAMGLPAIQEPIGPKLHVAQPEQPSRVVQFPAQEPERTDAKPTEPEADADSDPRPEDISWTAFWTWAKTNGFANRDALEQAIGQSINQLSPGQARKLAQTVIDAR